MTQNIVVAGFILPRHKQVRIALREIYGIGQTRALHICKVCNFAQYKKVSELEEQDVINIRNEVTKFLVGEELRNDVVSKIMRLSSIGCRRGVRRQKGLPVRGQRSKTNAKTSRRMRGIGMASAAITSSNLTSKNKGKGGATKGKKTTQQKKKKK